MQTVVISRINDTHCISVCLLTYGYVIFRWDGVGDLFNRVSIYVFQGWVVVEMFCV